MKILKLIKKFINPPKRLDLKLVSYAYADKLIKEGWTIAKEEDSNQSYGFVWLELLKKDND